MKSLLPPLVGIGWALAGLLSAQTAPNSASVSLLPSAPGCTIAPGTLPATVVFSATAPHLGQDCLLRIDQSPSFVYPFHTTWIVLASPPTESPLPVLLGSTTPCWFWGDPAATGILGTITFPSIAGSGSLRIPVPPDPALAGARLHLQAYRVGVPGTPSTATLSAGLALLFGT